LAARYVELIKFDIAGSQPLLHKLDATIVRLQNMFNAATTLESIQTERAIKRRRCTWGRSRLTKYRAELVSLRQAGASLGDLAYWLKSKYRVNVQRSTIDRYLKKLPEFELSHEQN
jgi:hypothetical protein